MEKTGCDYFIQRGRVLLNAIQEHSLLRGIMGRRDAGYHEPAAGDSMTADLADTLRLVLELSPGTGPVGVVMAPDMARALRQGSGGLFHDCRLRTQQRRR